MEVLLQYVNENNATIALFKKRALTNVYRVETSLSGLVTTYSERRKSITRGRSARDRVVKRKFRKLREKGRKLDILRKTASFIEGLALEKQGCSGHRQHRWKGEGKDEEV
jgi:hypothetical protein